MKPKTEKALKEAIREVKKLHQTYKVCQAAANKAQADWKAAASALEDLV
ncbi:MAG: hypothetical protein PHX61_02360 [Alphaproteobacteria bacterium]|nr:hypothetical protein [Alphaproteobacteria bacterium]